jgi:tetratricopeptide (TPR) repeat protein
MKHLQKFTLTFTLLACIGFSALAQNPNATNDLIKQGVDLHNQGKYADAIDKFNEALKADPENVYAHYELAFSLYSSKKPKEAIPHLEKAVKADKKDLAVAACSLLASIYDDDAQHQKAIDTYKAAIAINPDYPQIFYNLGICYFRNQQYAEAELSAIDAIKHNPKNASSQRLYALVTFHQNKQMNALMGLCSFILLEPNTPRSTEAYGNIQHILQGGVITDTKGNSTLTISPQEQKEAGTLNLAISMSVLSAKSKNLTGTDLLEYELKTIFTIAGQLAEKKTDKTFFDKFFVDYLYKLAQSNNMSAFAHTIALTVNKDESAKWAKENMAAISALGDWLQKTERTF